MIDAFFDLSPVLAVTAGLVIALPFARFVRDGQREQGTWTPVEARIIDVRRRVPQPDDDPFDAVLREHHLALCRYETAGGLVVTGWVGRRSIEPLGGIGDVVPLWYATDDPQAFTMWEPRPGRLADVLVTCGAVAISTTLAATVFTLSGIA